MVTVAVEPTVPEVGARLDPQAPPPQPPAPKTGEGNMGIERDAIQKKRNINIPYLIFFMIYFYSAFWGFLSSFS